MVSTSRWEDLHSTEQHILFTILKITKHSYYQFYVHYLIHFNVLLVSGLLYFVSSVVNPILYNVLSKKYRTAFKRTLCQCWPKSGYTNDMSVYKSSRSCGTSVTIYTNHKLLPKEKSRILNSDSEIVHSALQEHHTYVIFVYKEHLQTGTHLAYCDCELKCTTIDRIYHCIYKLWNIVKDIEGISQTCLIRQSRHATLC